MNAQTPSIHRRYWSLLAGLWLCACGPVSETPEPQEPMECPFDIPLEEDDLPCVCWDEQVDSLPDDGSTCTCDSVADLRCV